MVLGDCVEGWPSLFPGRVEYGKLDRRGCLMGTRNRCTTMLPADEVFRMTESFLVQNNLVLSTVPVKKEAIRGRALTAE